MVGRDTQSFFISVALLLYHGRYQACYGLHRLVYEKGVAAHPGLVDRMKPVSHPKKGIAEIERHLSYDKSPREHHMREIA